MATDGSELEVSCRLRPRATPGPASSFVLVPSSGSPCVSTDEGSAGAARDALVLQDGDNVVEIVERDAVGVGLENAEGGLYERQVLLKTVNSSTMVMLKAYSDLRVRGKKHTSASPSPRKPRASPARKTVRPLSPAGKGLRATSPTKMLRVSPAKMLRASPGRAGRGMSGGATKMKAGAQQFLLVGDTLDLGIFGTKGSSYRFSYTLQLASSATAPASGAGTPGKLAPGAVKPETATPPKSSSRAEPPGSSGRGRGTDTKRRLEDIFNDKNVVGEAGGAAGRSAVSSAVCAKEGNDGMRVTPTPIEVVEVGDDDDDDDGKGAAPAPAPTTAPKRRRRNDCVLVRSQPVGVVDLCGSDDRPVDAGASKDAPLDLCDSDDEGNADERRAPGAQAAGRGEATGSFGGGPSSFFSSSLGRRGGGAPSKNRPPKPTRLVPASRKNHAPTDASSTAGGSAALAVVKADVPWEIATSSTAVRKFRMKVERPASPSLPSPSGATPGEGAAALLSQKPPIIPRGIASSRVSSKVGGKEVDKEEKRRQQQRERREDKKAFSIFTLPRKRDVKSTYLDVGAAGAAPTIAAGTRRASTPMPTTTRALTRMDDLFRRTVRRTIKECPESSVPVVKEVLGRGTAPDGGLCETIVSSLLESRCNIRTECLRRQLHAMLDVDPDSWTPPEDTAPAWLDDLHAVITARRSALTESHGGRPPSDAILTAHVAVLEVVVDYVVAGRASIVSGGSSGGSGGDEKGVLLALAPHRDGLKAAERVMQFFECLRKKGRWEREPTQWDRVRHAVETSAAWAIGAFGRSEEGGEGAGSLRGGHRVQQRRRQRRPESPALARARLLTARLLAEVVETCGLTAEAACLAIVDQMNSFAGGASADGAGVREEPCRGLGAAARGGLVRALLGRPFCVQLAHVLLADLKGAGDAVVEGDAGGVGRLEALLLRVINREQRRAGAGVLLF
ncbi:unnamed protein product [Scytosiphon promiscuus]